MSNTVWHERYSTPPKRLPRYDGWLDIWLDVIPTRARVLDLGCGRGTDAHLLNSRRCSVVHADFVQNVVAYVNRRVGNCRGVVLDHSRPLPFGADRFQVVVGDLSLHYFCDDQMSAILADIQRVLEPNGLVLARVNSQNDLNYGAREGSRGTVDGVHKEFYSLSRTRNTFGRHFRVISIKEYPTNCYGPPKHVVEVAAEARVAGPQRSRL